MLKIFNSVIDSPKTAQQISDECSIPKSTVYRKLRKLEDNQIILRKGKIENGIRNRLYKTINDVHHSKLDQLCIETNRPNLTATFDVVNHK